jgi:hypothetical protein
MSDTQDKQIKIKISSDDSSVYKFKAMIGSMTSSVEKLATTLDKVTRSLEGFSKAQGKMKGGSVGPTTTPGGKSGGIAETIIGSGDGSAVRNAAKATEQALSSTGDHIKRFVDKAIQDINRLNAATKGAGQGTNYSGWSSSGGGSGGGGGGMGGGGGAGPGYSEFERGIRGIEPAGGGGNHRGGFWTGRRSIFSPTMVQDEEESASRLWGPRGFAGYAEGRGQAFGRMAGLPVGGQNLIGQGAKALGGSVGLLGGVALGAAALWNYGGTAFEDVRAARIDFMQSQPFVKRGGAMAGLGLYQSMYAAADSGDVARVMAFQRANKNSEVMKSIHNTALDEEARDLKFHNNPQSARSWILKGKDWIQSKAANAFQSSAEGGVSVEHAIQKGVGSALSMIPGLGVLNSAMSTVGSLIDTSSNGDLQKLPGADGKSILQLQQAQSFAETATEKANRLKAATDYEQFAANPRTAQLANTIYQGASSRLNMARMAGKGVGWTKKGGLKYELWEAKLKRGGWMPENEAAGHQQLLQIGAGYSSAIDPMSITALGMAGLGNASQIAQIGGILGGSVGAGGLRSGLLGQLQHSIGKGGLDVAVGRDLFSGLGTSMMQAGTWGNGNLASTALGNAASFVGMVDANGHPTIDVSQQQRMMSMYTQGNAAGGTFTKGTGAPIYNAMSLQSAISAMGGYSLGTESMRGLDVNQLVAIKNGADIPAYYRDQFTKDEVVKFLDKTKNMSLSTISDSSLIRPGAGKDLFNAIRAEESKGGGAASYILNKTKGMSTAGQNIMTLDIAERLGGVISAAHGGAITPLAATGMVLQDLQKVGMWTNKVNGKGVGVAGPSGGEKLSLDEQADILAEKGHHFEKTDRKGIERAFKEMLKQQNADIQAIEAIGGSVAGDIESVSNGLITAIEAYSNWFKTHGGAASAGSPVKAKSKGARENSNGMHRKDHKWVQ